MIASGMAVNVLGTHYVIFVGSGEGFACLKDNDGSTDTSTKQIFINDMSYVAGDDDRKRNIGAYMNKVLRHEIVHAFLAESGLDGNGMFSGHWEHNEEMVDWFAIQGPKIYKAWEMVGAV